MALLNTNNRYIKLYKDGRYEFYASEEARNKVKSSVSSDTVLAKYAELLVDLESPEQLEFRYYDPEGFDAIYSPLLQEYRDYQYNLGNYITEQEYPIMAQYYPDVANSIPEIVSYGYIPRDYTDLEDAYTTAKRLKRFGDTQDV